MSDINTGEVVTVTLRDVHVVSAGLNYLEVELAAERLLTIGTDEGNVEVTRGGRAEQDERIAKILELLDAMAYEECISPSVPATARKIAGLPPRHWPPQPGDVWHDGFPFGPSLWFAQILHETGHSHLVMVPTERRPDNTGGKTPEEFLEYACEIALVYRRKDGDR